MRAIAGVKCTDKSDPPLPSGARLFFDKWLNNSRLSRLHDACGAQAGDFLRAIADLGEDLFGVLAQHR